MTVTGRPRKLRGVRPRGRAAKGSAQWSDGLDYDLVEGTPEGFIRTHDDSQLHYAHAIMHSGRVKRGIGKGRARRYHNAIVKYLENKGIYGIPHETPLT